MDSFLIKATKDNIENINELENRIFSFGYEGSLTVEDLAKGMKTKLDLAKMAVSLFRVMKESLKLLKKCCEDYANKETSFGEKLERMGATAIWRIRHMAHTPYGATAIWRHMAPYGGCAIWRMRHMAYAPYGGCAHSFKFFTETCFFVCVVFATLFQ